MARLLARSALLALLAALLFSSRIWAADPQLTFVAPQPEPIDIALTTQGQERRGQFRALVRNESAYAGPVTIAFAPVGAAPADGLRFTPVAAVAAPGGIFAVEGQFDAPIPAQPRTVEGVLTVGTGGDAQVRPAALRVRVIVATAPAPLFEPATVAVGVTCWVPGPFQRWFDRPCRPVGSSAATIVLRGGSAATPAAVTRYLASEGGGVAAVELAPVVASPGVWSLAVQQPQSGRKYQGVIALDPTNERSAKVSATVVVQDVLLWPLLTLICGVAVAGVLLWWRDVGRPKRLLAAEVKGAEQALRDAAKGFTLTPLYSLLPLFPVRPHHYPNWWRVRWADDATRGAWSPAERLYADVFRAAERGDLDAARARVGALRGRAEAWVATAKAQQALDTAQKEALAAGLPPTLPIAGATADLLLPLAPAQAPQTVVDAEALLGRLRDQTRATTLAREAYDLYFSSLPLYRSLLPRQSAFFTAAERALLHEHNPGRLFLADVVTATSLHDLTGRDVVPRLRRAALALAWLDARYPLRSAAPPGALALPATPAIALPHWLPGGVDTRSAGEIVDGVRFHDRWDFVASGLIVAVPVLLTLYLGKSFGTWEHYAGVFFAGAGGTVAINWTLLPWYRSYRASTSQSPKD